MAKRKGAGTLALHFFESRVAEVVGERAAVLFQNIAFWVEKNVANERNFFDGRYWTYSTGKAFQELFPYMTEKSVRTALKRLETEGLIVTGYYNKSSYDRTKWYSITEYGYELLGNMDNAETDSENSNFPKGKIEKTEKENESSEKGEPIPYITPYKETDITTDNNTLIREDDPKGKRDQIPYQEIVDQYNAICISLPKVTRLNKQRKSDIKARYTEYSHNEIIDVFRKAQASDFLTGRSGSWNATFDWLMKPSNFLKVAEGNYANPIRAVNSEPNELQDFYERVARWASKKEEDDEDE